MPSTSTEQTVSIFCATSQSDVTVTKAGQVFGDTDVIVRRGRRRYRRNRAGLRRGKVCDVVKKIEMV